MFKLNFSTFKIKVSQKIFCRFKNCLYFCIIKRNIKKHLFLIFEYKMYRKYIAKL